MNSQFLPSSISRGVSLFFVTVCLINVSWDASAHPLEYWHWRIPETPTRNLNSVTFGQDRFVAVGNGGIILTSVDGLSWQSVESNAFENLRGVSFLEDQFVAVGELGAVFVSTNGFDWSRRETGYFYDLNAIAHGNGLYVAVGDGGVIMTSTDLSSWDVRVLGNQPLHGVAFGNGTFVVVGGTMQFSDDVAGIILISPDGFFWSSRDARGIYSLHGISFENGRFLASGGLDFYSSFGGYGSSPTLLSSSDGKVWSIRIWIASGYPYQLQKDVAFGDGQYLAVGDNGPYGAPLLLSSNLSNWHIVQRPLSSAPFTDVAYGHDQFVVVAKGGAIAVVRDETTATVAERDSSGASPFASVRFGLGRFVALLYPSYPDQTANSVFVSTNGVVWQEHELVPSLPPAVVYAEDITITNLALAAACAGLDRYVAVGGGQTYQLSNGVRDAGVPFSCIFDSLDGENWTLRHFTHPEFNGGWSRVFWSGNQFLATRADGQVALSPNGIDWTEHHVAELESGISSYPMAGGNGRFVAYQPVISPGTNHTFLVSQDGTNWTEVLVPAGQSVGSIAFGGDRFVAVGYQGGVLLSTNGLQWTQHQSLFGALLYSPAWTEGGYAALMHPNRLVFSPDGQQWTTYDVIPHLNPVGTESTIGRIWLSGIAGGNGRFLVWGSSEYRGGFLLQSDPLNSQPPSIDVQPSDLSLGISQTRTLPMIASGSAPLHFQWHKDGLPIPSATRPHFEIIDSQLSDSGNYFAVVTNDFGSVTSRVAQVVVAEPALELALKHELRWVQMSFQGYPTNLAPTSVIELSGPLGHTWAIDVLDGLDSTNDWQDFTNVFLWNDTEEIEDTTVTNSPQRLYRGRLID